MGRDRSQALVVRGLRVLMVKHHMFGRDFYCLPGGGIEEGETPEAAALRELLEEAGVSGTVVQKINTFYKQGDKGAVFTYWIEIPEDAEPFPGRDPELSDDEQTIVGTDWMLLEEMSELDSLYLWASGIKAIPQFYEKIQEMKK